MPDSTLDLSLYPCATTHQNAVDAFDLDYGYGVGTLRRIDNGFSGVWNVIGNSTVEVPSNDNDLVARQQLVDDRFQAMGKLANLCRSLR